MGRFGMREYLRSAFTNQSRPTFLEFRSRLVKIINGRWGVLSLIVRFVGYQVRNRPESTCKKLDLA